MSKTNTEAMQQEAQAPEAAGSLKLDVRVRPIAPMGNLLGYASVTIATVLRSTASVSVPGRRGCM